MSLKATLLLLCGAVLVAAVSGASRVCIATPGDFTSATSIGFCTDAVYVALKPAAKGATTFVNPTIDSNWLTGGIRLFGNRKTTYPQVNFYIGVTGAGTDPNVASLLSNLNYALTFIRAQISFLQQQPTYTGIYVEFTGLTAAQAVGYDSFLNMLYTQTSVRGYRAAAALPGDFSLYGNIYFTSIQNSMNFNLLKTYEDFNAAATTLTHPIAPLNALPAPFNSATKTIATNVNGWIAKGVNAATMVLGLPMYSLQFVTTGANAFGQAATSMVTNTYCSALMFGATNPPSAAAQGEAYARSPNTFYTYNTYAATLQKLNYATTNGLAGVGVFSLNTAGSANAELLRYITSVMDPTGVYPAKLPATCGVPVP